VKHSSFLYKIVSFAGQSLIKVTEAILSFFSKDKEAMLDTTRFSWVRMVEQNTEVILTELRQVLADYDAIPYFGDLSEEQKRIVTGRQNWKTFLFYAYGVPIAKNISLCPRTHEIIRQIPSVTTAFFSILEPHTAISPHRGPYKGVLRYHLGLIVPEPIESCGIRVDGQIYHWQVGQSLIFDDTFMHDAWNDNNEKRVVLFIDFKRDYIFPVNIFNNFIIALIRWSPFVSNVLKNLEKAEHNV
jgi:beta-hydroxylase